MLDLDSLPQSLHWLGAMKDVTDELYDSEEISNREAKSNRHISKI